VDTNSDNQNQEISYYINTPGVKNADTINDSYVFQSGWFRRVVCDSNALHQFLLVNGYCFLWIIDVLFWIVFLSATYLY
jgi:hypothetical protein